MRDDHLNKILYVEDDADIRKIVSMSLEVVGDYTVHACGSCADALEVVAQYKRLGVFDVIVKPFDPMALSDRIAQIWHEYRSGGHDDTR